MALYQNSGVTEDQIRQVAIKVTKHLKGKCKFCPRSFEKGERIVFGTVKNIQMKFMEADVESGEPAGFGEQHLVDIICSHLPCAISNMHKLRSVASPRKLI